MKKTTHVSILLEVLLQKFATRGEFHIQEVYPEAVPVLAKAYPRNNTLEASIQANLQKLRDQGWLTFVDNEGTYSWA